LQNPTATNGYPTGIPCCFHIGVNYLLAILIDMSYWLLSATLVASFLGVLTMLIALLITATAFAASTALIIWMAN
tara:strand:+ start:598 stop:822 length:225 start_codon:yes stop_codon:yes gene_type:complete